MTELNMKNKEERKTDNLICKKIFLTLALFLIFFFALIFNEYIFNMLLFITNSINMDTITILLIAYLILTLAVILLLCLTKSNFLKSTSKIAIEINKEVIPVMTISIGVIFTISSILDFPGTNKKDIIEYTLNSFISSSIPVAIVLLVLVVFYLSVLSGAKIANVIKEKKL